MRKIKQCGIMVMALLLALNGWLPPAAWAQSAPPPKEEPSNGQEALAGASNIVYVPGKAIACVLSAGAWAVFMVLSFGGAYKDSAKLLSEGCGGKWSLTAQDFQSPRQPSDR
jgi:hypothetical protein